MSDQFTPKYADETTYRYTHTDGTEVKVNIDDVKAGGRVGAHHYDQDGSRMNYYSFRINNVEERQIVAEVGDDDEAIPDAVVVAIHAGGWEFLNLHQTDIAPEESDPIEVQLLDIRDGFRSYADQGNAAILTELFDSMARLVEIAVVMDATLWMAQESGKDPDEAFEETVEEHPMATPENKRSLKNEVEGWFLNAVYPETERSKEHHNRIVNCLEYARDMHRVGEDFGEQFEQAYKLGDKL